MAVEIRLIEPGEDRAFAESVCVPFLEPPDGAAVEACLIEHEADRCFAAVDRGRMVGNAAVLSLDVTVPGPPGSPCPVVDLAAVTSVGVHPTHRRRGILRRLMAAVVDQARERGEPLAGLTSSEGGIYGRFGFGVAVETTTVTLETAGVRFDRPPAPLDLALLDGSEAEKALPGILERVRRGRPGEVSRTAAAWTVRFRNLAYPRGPAPLTAACDGGYVTYRVRADDRGDDDRIEVLDLIGDDAEVEAGLWAFVTGVDLIRTVTASERPVGESLRWRLADPRAW